MSITKTYADYGLLDLSLLRAVTARGAVTALVAVRALEDGDEPDWRALSDEMADAVAGDLPSMPPEEAEEDARRSAALVVLGMTAFYGAIQAAALHPREALPNDNTRKADSLPRRSCTR